MLHQKIVILYLSIVLCDKLLAQVSQTNRVIQVHKTLLKIKVDGTLNEEAWQLTAVADSFINKWPTDSGKAKLQTSVQITYDDRFM